MWVTIMGCKVVGGTNSNCEYMGRKMERHEIWLYGKKSGETDVNREYM